MVRFLHTSDWQLGAGFGQVPGDKGALLRAERLESLARIGKLAEEYEVQFILAAGDLYDAHTVDNEIVTRSLETIARYPVPVYAIPGNHDFVGAPESVYARQRFLDRCPEQFQLLKEAAVKPVDGVSASILPCPLVQRHTVSDPTRWMAGDGANSSEGHLRIGLAHGSVVAFESEEGGTTPNLIDPAIVDTARLDYLALGDWHGVKEVNPKAWYSGTPEPDRFKTNRSGHVLVVEIDGPGAIPRVEVVSSAGCQWLRHEASLHESGDVDRLERWFGEIASPQKALVRLEYDGVLGMEDLSRLENLLDTQSELLLNLRRRGDGMHLKPTDEELASLGREGLTGRIAERLRSAAEQPGDEGKVASLALQMLFQRTRQAGGAS